MKLKNLFQILGFRSGAKRYLYKINKFNIENGIEVNYAQWMHPSESQKVISQEQVNAYREVLEEGDFCIDIGAHTGDTTLPIAIATGLKGLTLALEPNPFVYHVLEKNVRANRDITNIKTIMAAAAPEECFMQFEYSDAGFCNGGRHEGISVLRHGHAYKLDVFGLDLVHELKSDYKNFLPKLKFIKIDTEGYDLYILQFISEIIQTYRPYVKTEIFKKTSVEYRKDLFSFFLEKDYSIYKIDNEPIGKGQLLNLDHIRIWKHFDILCVPNKVT